MDESFGGLLLSILSICDGKILGAGLSNKQLEEEFARFSELFRNNLISYLNTGNENSKNFLMLCCLNIQKIFNSDFSFLLEKN